MIDPRLDVQKNKGKLLEKKLSLRGSNQRPKIRSSRGDILFSVFVVDTYIFRDRVVEKRASRRGACNSRAMNTQQLRQ